MPAVEYSLFKRHFPPPPPPTPLNFHIKSQGSLESFRPSIQPGGRRANTAAPRVTAASAATSLQPAVRLRSNRSNLRPLRTEFHSGPTRLKSRRQCAPSHPDDQLRCEFKSYLHANHSGTDRCVLSPGPAAPCPRPGAPAPGSALLSPGLLRTRPESTRFDSNRGRERNGAWARVVELPNRNANVVN